MEKPVKRFQIVQHGKDHMADPIEDCPFPTSQLVPPYPLSDADRAALKAQIEAEKQGASPRGKN